MWRVMMGMIVWNLCACDAQKPAATGRRSQGSGGSPSSTGPRSPSSTGPRSPMTVLFLPGFEPGQMHLAGVGPALTFPVFEAAPAAAFVQLAAGTADHRLFAERLITQGREVPVSSAAPGVLLPVTGPSTQVWAPRLGHVTDAEPGRLQYRPSRTQRARAEVVACPGEIAWTDRDAQRVRLVRVRGCPGPVQLEFPTHVGVPGPAGRIEPATRIELREDEVGTWIWREDGHLWAVSLGILKIGAGRVVWHREGPVEDAVFGPADWIGLRDGELDIHLQAGFIRGALRALFSAIASRPAPWTVAQLHPLADLRLALAQAPGSWERELVDEAVLEVQDFVRERLAAGHRVALAGVGPVVPVTQLVPPELFAGTGASMLVPGAGSVLFLYDDPGPGSRRRLEAELARLHLTAARNYLLFRVPGGYRLDLPPGTAIGRCGANRTSCAPPDSRGLWAGAPWLTGWVRMPEGTVEPPAGFLSGFLEHLRMVVNDRKYPDSFNE